MLSHSLSETQHNDYHQSEAEDIYGLCRSCYAQYLYRESHTESCYAKCHFDECRCAKCHYDECHWLSAVTEYRYDCIITLFTMSVIMLSVMMLSVIMLSFLMLNV